MVRCISCLLKFEFVIDISCCIRFSNSVTPDLYPFPFHYLIAMSNVEVVVKEKSNFAQQATLELFSLRDKQLSPPKFSTTLRRVISPIIMSDEPQEMKRQSDSSSPSAPYNPRSSPSHEPAVSTVGNSVVHDLLRVYESLTHSSTPQVSTEQDGETKPSSPSTQTHEQTLSPHYHPPPAAPLHSSAPHSPYHIPPPAYLPSQDSPLQYPPPVVSGQSQTPYQYGFSQQQYMGSHEAMLEDQHHYASQPQSLEQAQAQPGGEDDENDSETPQETNESTSSRRKRRGSGNSGKAAKGKGRKKTKVSDGRWAKRFTWPEELHRDFVSAIFDVGLKHSSPSTILEHMPNQEQITTERIKSHLQKYRLHRVKSKKEFLSSYEASLQNFQSRGLNGVKTISNGEVAAHLSYSIANNSSTKGAKLPDNTEYASAEAAAPATVAPTPQKPNESLVLPRLTETEKLSPIGSAMGHLMGLFFSLKQQLMAQRVNEARGSSGKQGNGSVQDVFSMFASGGVATANIASSGHEYTIDPSSQQLEGAASMKAAASGPGMSTASVRTNIEENSLMKREMQSQMALQNKMRALKQQELNKYKNVSRSQLYVNEEGTEKLAPPSDSQLPLSAKEEENLKVGEVANGIQGAGETAGNDAALANNSQRQHSLSIDGSEEFWNSDVVDDQLFEFLMNN